MSILMVQPSDDPLKASLHLWISQVEIGSLGSLSDIVKVSLGTLSTLGKLWELGKATLNATESALAVKAVKIDLKYKRLLDLGKTRFDFGKIYFVFLGKVSRNPLYCGTRTWENPALGEGSRTLGNLGMLSQASQLPQDAVQGLFVARPSFL